MQTSLLALVSVLMQIIFVAIAWYNFTAPDIDDNSVRGGGGRQGIPSRTTAKW